MFSVFLDKNSVKIYIYISSSLCIVLNYIQIKTSIINCPLFVKRIINLYVSKYSLICSFSFRIKCPRCVNGIQTKPPPPDSDCTDDLSCWHHCREKRWLIDPILKRCWDAGISFVFYQTSHKIIRKVSFMCINFNLVVCFLHFIL